MILSRGISSIPPTCSGDIVLLRKLAPRCPKSRNFYARLRGCCGATRSTSTQSATSEQNQSRADWLYERQKSDIIPNDLAATLEAHRRSNAEQIVRRIKSERSSALQDRQTFTEDQHDGVSPESGEQGATEAQNTSKFVKGFRRVRLGEQGMHDDERLFMTPDMVISNQSRTDQRFPKSSGASQLDVQVYEIQVAEENSEENRRGIKISFVKDREQKVNREKIRQARATGSYVKPVRYDDGVGIPYWPPYPGGTSLASERSKRQALSQDIRHVSAWLQLTPDEKLFRELQVRTMVKEVGAALKDIELFPFGSLNSGLSTSTSDIDIGFRLSSMKEKGERRGPSVSLGRPVNRKLVMNKLKEIAQHLGNSGQFVGFTYVNAKYPLLKTTHQGSGVEIQFVYSDESTAREAYTGNYLAEYPHLKDVYMIVKAALGARGLKDPLTGGFGSYPLLMMIVASFKHFRMFRFNDISSSLLAFLEFCTEINTHDEGISVDPPHLFEKQHVHIVPSLRTKEMLDKNPILSGQRTLSRVNADQPWALCLQDPADPFNDLGRRSFRIMDIKVTFATLLRQLKAYLEGSATVESVATQTTQLGSFFGFTLGELRDHRKKFEDWYASDSGQRSMSEMRQNLKSGNHG